LPIPSRKRTASDRLRNPSIPKTELSLLLNPFTSFRDAAPGGRRFCARWVGEAEVEPFCGRDRSGGPDRTGSCAGWGGGAGARRRNPERSEGTPRTGSAALRGKNDLPKRRDGKTESSWVR